MLLVSGREHGGNQFDMKQPVTALPSLLLFLLHLFWCHTSRGGRNAGKGKQQQRMSFSLQLSGRVGLQTCTHTDVCSHTHTSLCSDSTSCLTFAHYWWLKCENTLAPGLGSGWGLVQPPPKKIQILKALRKYAFYSPLSKC